VFITSCTNC